MTGLALLTLTAFLFYPPAKKTKTPLPATDTHRDQGNFSEVQTEIPQSQSKVPLIISAGKEGDLPWTSLTPAAHRVRSVTPNPLLLTPIPSLKKGDILELALFDDVRMEAVISEIVVYPNGTVGITTQLEKNFQGTLFLSYSGGELRAHAEVLGGNDYYLRYDSENKVHQVIEVDHAASDYQNECDCDLIDLKSDPVISEDNLGGTNSAPLSLGDTLSADLPPDHVVIDVMIVYTSAARAAEGGLNGINNNIALAMQKSNLAHGNSNTKVTLNLVHSAEVTYTESGNPSDDLYNLTYFGETYSAMDEVHEWRNTYSADMVCLLEDNPGTGGKGWVLSTPNGRPENAYCLARVQQTDSGYTLVHEWAHNMGCKHSMTQYTQTGPGLYSYSSGWQWNDSAASASLGYCSVMTYQNFNGSGGNEYTRLPYFSNPDISYTDNSTSPTGHATDGDNAQGIRNIRYVIADYRIAPSPVSGFPSSNRFEQAYSPWIYYGSELDWKRNSGTTQSSSTGPSIADNGSWYIYMESSGDGTGFPNKTAILQASFDFSALANPEISYAYHMYGSSMGSLYLEVSTDLGSSWAILWSLSGDQGDTWLTQETSLMAYAGEKNVTLRFRGVTGDSFRSDMALDTIIVQDISTDIDGDGIPNNWEIEHFGGATNAVAGANPDFDSYTNLEEYIAGLNPNIFDTFGPSNLTLGASNWFEWNTARGRVYSVYWSGELLSNFTLLQSNLIFGAFTDTLHSAESEGFYKLEVQLAP